MDSLVLASIDDDFCLNQWLLLWCLPNGDFLISLFILHYLLAFFRKKGLFLFSMSSFPFLSLFFLESCIPILFNELKSFNIIILDLASVFSLQAGLYVLIILWWGTARYSGFILYFSCPNPGISRFTEEPWFLWMENGIFRN